MNRSKTIPKLGLGTSDEKILIHKLNEASVVIFSQRLSCLELKILGMLRKLNMIFENY